MSRVDPRTPREDTTGQLPTAEVLAFVLVAVLVAAMAASYLLDRVGAGISPHLILLLSLACGASLGWAAGRSARHDTGDLPPAGAAPVFVYRAALARALSRTSLPVAIADVSLIPREVREDLDVQAQFGQM